MRLIYHVEYTSGLIYHVEYIITLVIYIDVKHQKACMLSLNVSSFIVTIV